MSDPRPQLEYAPRARFHQRRWFRRALWGIVAAVVLASAAYFADPVVVRLRLLSAQREAMAISYPSTQVAWEEAPARIAAWTAGARSGPGWATLTGTQGGLLAAYVAPPAFGRVLMMPKSPGGGVAQLYVGARDGGAGRRLVAVCVEGVPYRFMRPAGAPLGIDTLRVVVMRPAALTSPPMFYADSWADPDVLDRVPAGTLRFYWGQPDPADASRFTIAYETTTGKGTIDGRLMADDTVRLKRVDGPATVPSLP
jgi:hypothetical protein